MNAPIRYGTYLVFFAGVALAPVDTRPQAAAATVQPTAAPRDGQGDFDYNPDSHQWSLNFSNSATGTLSQPTIGEFKNGRGEFYDQEMLNGRAIFVRFIIAPVTPDSICFEQSFSNDGGKTWERNWVAVDTRVKESTR